MTAEALTSYRERLKNDPKLREEHAQKIRDGRAAAIEKSTDSPEVASLKSQIARLGSQLDLRLESEGKLVDPRVSDLQPASQKIYMLLKRHPEGLLFTEICSSLAEYSPSTLRPNLCDLHSLAMVHRRPSKVQHLGPKRSGKRPSKWFVHGDE